MNYVIYPYYIIFKIDLFDIFRICFDRTFRKQKMCIEMYFGILGVFCTINYYFEYRIRIMCIFLYMGTYFKDIFRHFSNPQNHKIFDPPKVKNKSRSVNNFRIEDF